MERNRKDKFAAAIDVVIFGGWCSEYDKVSGVLRTKYLQARFGCKDGKLLSLPSWQVDLYHN
jgi:hypothetical protein